MYISKSKKLLALGQSIGEDTILSLLSAAFKVLDRNSQ